MATRNRAILDLPMTAQCHDPTNTRTLDVSPNALHATFGAGAATPTKIAGQRGYSFDGSDYLDCGDSSLLDFDVSDTMTFCVVASIAATPNRCLLEKSGAGVGYSLNYVASPNTWYIYFKCDDSGGGGALYGDSQFFYGPTPLVCIVLSLNRAGGSFLYLNGIPITLAGSLRPGTYVNADTFNIGYPGSFVAAYWSGAVNRLAVFKPMLSPTQAQDWTSDAKRHINDV